MRQIICDNKGCRLEPSSQNVIGRGRVNTLRGGGGGLAPRPVSKLIPIEEPKRKSEPVKRKPLKKKPIKRKSLVGGSKKKPKVVRKRNCVKKK